MRSPSTRSEARKSSGGPFQQYWSALHVQSLAQSSLGRHFTASEHIDIFSSRRAFLRAVA